MLGSRRFAGHAVADIRNLGLSRRSELRGDGTGRYTVRGIEEKGFVRAMNLGSGILALLLAFSAPAAAADPQEAQQLVRENTRQMLEVLREEAADGEFESDRMRSVVEQYVLPHLDFVTMTKLAVGRDWLKADSGQKKALVSEFRRLLMSTYTSALGEYDDQEFEFLPLEAGEDDTRVEVRSRFDNGDGSKIPVTYRLHVRDGRWMMYDIRVDDISLVTTYRSSFSDIVSREGIDGLISHLEQKNASNTAKTS